MNQVFPLLTGYLGWAQLPSLDPVMHPVYAYLIVTAGGASILVDSGNPRSLMGQEHCHGSMPRSAWAPRTTLQPAWPVPAEPFPISICSSQRISTSTTAATPICSMTPAFSALCKPRFSTMRWRGTARAGALEQTGCAIRVRHRRLRARARNYAP